MPVEVTPEERLRLFLWENYTEICAEYVVYRLTRVIANEMNLAVAINIAYEFSLYPIQVTIEMLMDIAAEKELLPAAPKDS